MNEAAPLVLHRALVLPEWVDYNGHMSEAYYVLVFGHATDAFLDHVGMDDAARRATRTSLFTAEAHINYLHETHDGEALRIATQLLGHDAKRVHLHHAMARERDGTPLAATELMLLHVDTTTGRTAPMPPVVSARIAGIAAAHATLSKPPHTGRVIAIPAPRQAAGTA